MFFSTLKVLQLLAGIVLTGLFLAAPVLMQQLYPGVFPVASAYGVYAGNPLQVMLAAASANLMAGCYQIALPPPRQPLQILASVSLLVAAIASAVSALGRLHVDPVMDTLPGIGVVLLLVGLALHLICNLHLLNPATTRRSTSPRSSKKESSNREGGTVKWFNVSKGFGFITRDSGGDIFVHYRAIRGKGHRTLNEGQRVGFLVAKTDKGLQAEDVTAPQ